MAPPREASADKRTSAREDAITAPEAIATAIAEFLSAHTDAVLLEDGKVLFELSSAKHTLSTDHGRCVLHVWSEDRNLVRTVVSADPRRTSLRLSTARFGQTQTKRIELAAAIQRRSIGTRETTRNRFVTLLERVLEREFPEWKCDGFRTAMDLERSFGPAYARGSLVRGRDAWAVIAVNASESATTIDGILTLGILWLDHCRSRAEGKRLFRGLRVVVPRGAHQLTQARMAWLNEQRAEWQLFTLNEKDESLVECDIADTGNIRTRLVHRPDEAAARERFAAAIDAVMSLVPTGEEHRVDQQLRSTAELAFLLHGLPFARARISLAPRSFTHVLEITVGAGAEETPLTDANHEELRALIADLFTRRRIAQDATDFRRRTHDASRRIGQQRSEPAHSRVSALRRRTFAPAQDPLFRAAPEGWLEAAVRHDLTALSRGLAPTPARNADDDNRGNRIEQRADQRVLPRLDPRYVYSQVPAIAGASDRGLLDLLGITADGRLAVFELKADEDLHFAMQGLDYWVRVRAHHLAAPDPSTGLGEFQRHGYFVGAELSPLPPRLYLVAPALRIHPATETVLRYISPRVDWQLIALDERWREHIRVVWRKSSK